MPNRLINEPSPYLRQHAHNPVDWYPWSEETLDKAKAEDKMIFLSVGYSSCHWCHVMERESFEDKSTAAYMNEHFINIKVDREERPDVDAVYMEAVQMMSGQGGWPMSVWLTPDQVPVFGGTYFPPQPAHGRPSFRQILERLVDVFANDREMVNKRVNEIRASLQTDLLTRIQSAKLGDAHFNTAAEHYAHQFDATDGGFSSAPKFPMAMGISFLLKYGTLFEDKKSIEMAAFSLESMIRGGIYDHIGGGFHRYSVDARWHVPHFEKMLYDNALLLNSITDAWLISGADLYKKTAEEIIAFLIREMKDDSGGFYSALDADSDGVEGKFYVWSKKEIEALLPEKEAEIFCSVYSITSHGNWENTNIPHLTETMERHALLLETDVDSLQYTLENGKKILLEARNKRIRPGLDDKVITAWNAMLLKSLSRAARAFERNDWEKIVVTLADFLVQKLLQEDEVMRFWKDGETRQSGFLDDTALLAGALTYVFELTGEPRWLETADKLCIMLMEQFYDAQNHGFYFNSLKHDTLISRNRDLFDNATPSGNAAAIEALWRTGMLTGKQRYIVIAEKSAQKLIETASKHATSFGYFLDICLMMQKHKQEIIISGQNPHYFLDEMMKSNFNQLLVTSSDASQIPFPTFSGKAPVKGKTACYICEQFACQAPVVEP